MDNFDRLVADHSRSYAFIWCRIFGSSDLHGSQRTVGYMQMLCSQLVMISDILAFVITSSIQPPCHDKCPLLHLGFVSIHHS